LTSRLPNTIRHHRQGGTSPSCRQQLRYTTDPTPFPSYSSRIEHHPPWRCNCSPPGLQSPTAYLGLLPPRLASGGMRMTPTGAAATMDPEPRPLADARVCCASDGKAGSRKGLSLFEAAPLPRCPPTRLFTRPPDDGFASSTVSSHLPVAAQYRVHGRPMHLGPMRLMEAWHRSAMPTP
jgi:hypothetical protein